jgi:hypothetical protein
METKEDQEIELKCGACNKVMGVVAGSNNPLVFCNVECKKNFEQKVLSNFLLDQFVAGSLK